MSHLKRLVPDFCISKGTGAEESVGALMFKTLGEKPKLSFGQAHDLSCNCRKKTRTKGKKAFAQKIAQQFGIKDEWEQEGHTLKVVPTGSNKHPVVNISVYEKDNCRGSVSLRAGQTQWGIYAVVEGKPRYFTEKFDDYEQAIDFLLDFLS